jgi:archaellum component FlaC
MENNDTRSKKYDELINMAIDVSTFVDNIERDIVTLRTKIDMLVGEIAEVSSDMYSYNEERNEISPLLLDSIDTAISVLEYVKESSVTVDSVYISDDEADVITGEISNIDEMIGE